MRQRQNSRRRQTVQASCDPLTAVFGPLTAEIDVRVAIGARAFGDVRPPWRWGEFPIDPQTGIIKISGAAKWTDCVSGRKAATNNNLVRAFQLTLRLPHEESSDFAMLVTQRNASNNYVPVKYRNEGGERIYEFPVCQVLCASRSEELRLFEKAPALSVYTANKGQSDLFGSNRADVWIVQADGSMHCYQLVLQTLDDGDTFRVIIEHHWWGGVAKLPEPRAYEPTANPDIFAAPELVELVNQLIFLPGDTCPGFDQKAQILQSPTIRSFLNRHIDDFMVFDGDERNIDIQFAPTTAFKEQKMGFVKLWDLTRAGGFGIIHCLRTGGQIEQFQFRFRSFDLANTELNPNGTPDIARGDTVVWDRVHTDSTIDPRTGKPYLPLVSSLQVVSKTQA